MLKAAVWLHRWTGVALSLLFALWFASGAVLLFVPFPSLGGAEAASHAAVAPLAALRVAPASALAQRPAATALRLVALRGEPAYVVGGEGRDVVVSGVTGRSTAPLTAAEAGAVAAAFGGAPAQRVDGPLAYDQWVVHQAFDPVRPLFRVRLADREGTELYVSAGSGEVVQRTRGWERAWNWPGAVAHWLYVTPLRRSFAAWDWSVWSVSLVALATTLLGVGLGVWRTARALRPPRPVASPFRGWMRWHHLVGLAAGAVVTSWILSGWLSMDHGRSFSRGNAQPDASAAYAGTTLAAAAARVDAATIARIGPATRLEFGVVAGRLTFGAPGDAGPGVGEVIRALTHAWPGASARSRGAVAPADFWARAEGLGPATDRYDLRAPAGRTAPAHVYVDRATGRLLAVVDRSRAAYDVLYFGLHTFQWPGLAERPQLREAVVCALLALGGALSLTGLVVSCRRLKLSFQLSGRR